MENNGIRLIDANALKETLKGLSSFSNRVTVRQIEDCLLHDIFPRIIDEQPTVEAQPETDDGWIGVEEGLPEVKEHYRSDLVICYSPDGEHEYLFDYYEVNGFGQGCFTAEKHFGITITHWRLLPGRPKGE